MLISAEQIAKWAREDRFQEAVELGMGRLADPDALDRNEIRAALIIASANANQFELGETLVGDALRSVESSPQLYAAAVTLAARKGDLEDAQRLFTEGSRRFGPSSELLIAGIDVTSRRNDFRELSRLFDNLVTLVGHEGLRSIPFRSIDRAIGAKIQCGMFDEAATLCDEILAEGCTPRERLEIIERQKVLAKIDNDKARLNLLTTESHRVWVTIPAGGGRFPDQQIISALFLGKMETANELFDAFEEGCGQQLPKPVGQLGFFLAYRQKDFDRAERRLDAIVPNEEDPGLSFLRIRFNLARGKLDKAGSEISRLCLHVRTSDHLLGALRVFRQMALHGINRPHFDLTLNLLSSTGAMHPDTVESFRIPAHSKVADPTALVKIASDELNGEVGRIAKDDFWEALRRYTTVEPVDRVAERVGRGQGRRRSG